MWRSLARRPWLVVLLVGGGAWIARGQSFLNFESGHVRPLALSPAGDRLFAVNTPDNRLEIYTITAGGLSLAAEVAGGLEPVAVSPNGATVYAAVFNSGNRTTTITEQVVSNTNNPHGLPPPPPGSTPGAPSTGLIVKFNGTQWVDEINRDWSAFVPFALPDKDVFLINADSTPLAPAGGTNVVTGVGTVIFNMAVRPTNGKVYVANTDAVNQVRFEPDVRGRLALSCITVISGTTATPHHLNPHINYAVVPGPQSEIDRSLAFPTDMAFSADGNTVFVAGFGSGKIGAFNASDLEAGVITEQQTAVGQGPSGIVLDSANDRLYVMNRIDHTIP